MTGTRPLTLLLLLAAAAALLRLGPALPGTGVDAVSAATPGHVAVVGAATPGGEGAPASPTITDLARGAFYLSGSLHRAVDASSEWILVRPGHADLSPAARALHVELVGAVVGLLHDIAPAAEISLLVGGVPGSGVQAPAELAAALQAWLDAGGAGSARVELLHLGAAQTETVEVPDGGQGAAAYPVPIALLECDDVVNLAAWDGPLSGLRNLAGLAGAPEGPIEVDDPESARRIDLALLVQSGFTVLDLLAHEAAGPVLLAGSDGIAVDRVGLELGGHPPPAEVLAVAEERWLGVGELGNIKVAGLEVAGTWAPAPEDETGDGAGDGAADGGY